MPRRRRLVSWLGLALAIVVTAGACGDDGDDADEAETEAGYQLLFLDGWTLKQASDPPADDPLTRREIPPADWYAEYESLVPIEGMEEVGGIGGISG